MYSSALTPGLSDYGLRYAPHIPHFLRAGFRVITPDLPSVGCFYDSANSSMAALLGTQPLLHS
jgi:alpha-beta hydrolase superfamily lysophospholipase